MLVRVVFVKRARLGLPLYTNLCNMHIGGCGGNRSGADDPHRESKPSAHARIRSSEMLPEMPPELHFEMTLEIQTSLEIKQSEVGKKH